MGKQFASLVGQDDMPGLPAFGSGDIKRSAVGVEIPALERGNLPVPAARQQRRRHHLAHIIRASVRKPQGFIIREIAHLGGVNVPEWLYGGPGARIRGLAFGYGMIKGGF